MRQQKTHPIIICSGSILFTGYDFWSHPVWRSNERVASTNRFVELCTNSEIDELHFSIFSQQHILTFNITVNDFMLVKMLQTLLEKKNHRYCLHIKHVIARCFENLVS